MKLLSRLLLFLAVFVLLIIFFNYPKLNIISGYSAKYASSSIFVANRTLNFTDATDLDFAPINLAKENINASKEYVSSSTLGLLTRKAVYRKGLGSVLITSNKDLDSETLNS